MEKDKIFITSLGGDNYSPYWNIFLNKEKVEFEGAGINAPAMELNHYVPDHNNLSEQEIIDQLKEYFLDNE